MRNVYDNKAYITLTMARHQPFYFSCVQKNTISEFPFDYDWKCADIISGVKLHDITLIKWGDIIDYCHWYNWE